MKHTKKLAALFLALVMALSVMAVTAAAYGAEEHEHTGACSTETIQPRKPAESCPNCGRGMTEVGSGRDTTGKRYIDFQCKNDDCTYHDIMRLYW